MKAFYESRKYKSCVPLYISLTKGFDFLAHWHHDIELIYVIDGQIKVGINKENCLLQKGDLAISGSGDIHYYDSMDLNSNIYLMIFKPELIDSTPIWPQNLHFKSYPC